MNNREKKYIYVHEMQVFINSQEVLQYLHLHRLFHRRRPRAIHPAIRAAPPIGATAPNDLFSVKTREYRDPLNSVMPVRKSLEDAELMPVTFVTAGAMTVNRVGKSETRAQN